MKTDAKVAVRLARARMAYAVSGPGAEKLGCCRMRRGLERARTQGSASGSCAGGGVIQRHERAGRIVVVPDAVDQEQGLAGRRHQNDAHVERMPVGEAVKPHVDIGDRARRPAHGDAGRVRIGVARLRDDDRRVVVVGGRAGDRSRDQRDRRKPPERVRPPPSSVASRPRSHDLADGPVAPYPRGVNLSPARRGRLSRAPGTGRSARGCTRG